MFILKTRQLRIIEMHNKPEKEVVSMMGDVYVSPPRLLPLNEDLHIQRTRKIFMIMLGVCLVSFC